MPRATHLRFALALASLFALSALGAQSKPFRASKRTVAAIDKYVQSCVAHGWSGSVLVAAGGKVLLAKGYGLANQKKKVRNNQNTLFEVASVTKTVTALAILKLEELGKLSIQDPIAKYLPGVPKKFHDITIYHLLTHRSGMPGGAGGRGRNLEEAVQLAFAESSEDKKRKHKVGEEFLYWNGGYALLAGLIEEVSNVSYQQFCRKRVLAPAGMKASGFTGESRLNNAAMATGYEGPRPVRKAGDHPYGSYDFRYMGMGGLVTSVMELWRLDRALRAGKVLSQRSLDKAYRPFDAKAKRPYGCGWSLRESAQGTRRIEHGGDVWAFHTDYNRMVEEDGCIIVASNADHVPRGAIARAIEALLLGGKPTDLPPKVGKVKSRTLAQMAGVYGAEKGSGAIEVIPASGGVWIAVDKGAVPSLSLVGGKPRQKLMLFAARTRQGFTSYGWGYGTIELEFTGKRTKKIVARVNGSGAGKAKVGRTVRFVQR